MVFFSLDVFLNLYCSGQTSKVQKGVAIFSKCLLMPLLLLLYLSFVGRDYIIWVVYALSFHTVGDILLIPDKKVSFGLGMTAFLLGHLCYAKAFFISSIQQNYLILIIAVSIIALVEVRAYRILSEKDKFFAKAALSYSIGIILVIIAISFRFNATYIMALTGISLFAFSDFRIGLNVTKIRETSKAVVMATYIGGQALMVCSFII